MPLFKEKAEPIEARQWSGTMADARSILRWTKGGVITPESWTDKGKPQGKVLAFLVSTIHGDRAPVANQDWIVRHANGNVEMLTPEQMQARFDPVA
jgi:hypothetical protein